MRFDNLWRMPFPYVMALHQAPTDGGDHRGFHFHIEFHPPLRKPDLLKYLAGPEIGGGNFLSDTSPEEKAAELRARPDRPLQGRMQAAVTVARAALLAPLQTRCTRRSATPWWRRCESARRTADAVARSAEDGAKATRSTPSTA